MSKSTRCQTLPRPEELVLPDTATVPAQDQWSFVKDSGRYDNMLTLLAVVAVVFVSARAFIRRCCRHWTLCTSNSRNSSSSSKFYLRVHHAGREYDLHGDRDYYDSLPQPMAYYHHGAILEGAPPIATSRQAGDHGLVGSGDLYHRRPGSKYLPGHQHKLSTTLENPALSCPEELTQLLTDH